MLFVCNHELNVIEIHRVLHAYALRTVLCTNKYITFSYFNSEFNATYKERKSHMFNNETNYIS